jgi:twitching motility protein PilT
MIATPAVRALVRDNKAHQIYTILQTSGKEDMKTMNQSLYELVKRGLITYEVAMGHSGDPAELKRMFERG